MSAINVNANDVIDNLTKQIAGFAKTVAILEVQIDTLTRENEELKAWSGSGKMTT